MSVATAALWLAGAIFLAAKLALAIHAAWSLALLVGSRVPGRGRRSPSNAAAAPSPHVAALVVAHDEAVVIEGCVRSLCEQDYPADRLDVWVLADNCNDDTAKRAERAGARVLERRTGGAEGKSAALRGGIEAIVAEGRADAIAVFDADNVVERGFLSRIGERLASGDQVVQGAILAENADASWVAASSAIGFWSIAAVAQEPRERLGLSVAVMGTGYAASREVCAEHLVRLASLTDDLELGARLALRGVRVAYEPNAQLRDERPVRLTLALRQRERWLAGRWDVARRFVPSLLVAALSPSSRLSGIERLRALDVSVQTVTPSLRFTSIGLLLLSSAEIGLSPLLSGSATSVAGSFPAVAALALGSAGWLAAVPGMLRFGAPPIAWACHLLEPLYVLLSAPLAITALFRRDWRRTPHGGD